MLITINQSRGQKISWNSIIKLLTVTEQAISPLTAKHNQQNHPWLFKNLLSKKLWSKKKV